MVVAAPLAGQITERLKYEEVVWIAASLDDLTISMQDTYHKVVLTRDTKA